MFCKNKFWQSFSVKPFIKKESHLKLFENCGEEFSINENQKNWKKYERSLTNMVNHHFQDCTVSNTKKECSKEFLALRKNKLSSSSSSSNPFTRTPCAAQGIYEELPGIAVFGNSLDLVSWSSCASYLILYFLRHVLFGLPLLLYPWGFQSNAVFSIAPVSLCNVCPVQFQQTHAFSLHSPVSSSEHLCSLGHLQMEPAILYVMSAIIDKFHALISQEF